MTKETDPELDPYLKAVMERKAMDVVVLDVEDLTTVADKFIICSGRSSRQVMAIAEHVQVELKKQGIKPLSVEGKNTGHWILMDYGHILIHVFFEETREFYDLENLWADAGRVKISQTMENKAQLNGDTQNVQDGV